jgi:hypothetical protein
MLVENSLAIFFEYWSSTHGAVDLGHAVLIGKLDEDHKAAWNVPDSMQLFASC